MKKFVSVLLSLLMVSSLLAGCNGGGEAANTAASPETAGESKPEAEGETAQSSGDPIKLVVVGPMTGDTAEYGLDARRGAELAAEEINAKGGLLGGRMVEIEVYDDRGVTDEATAIAEKIAADDTVTAVVSCHLSSTVALAACPAYQRAGIPALSASSSHPDYAKIGDFVLRNNITDLPEVQNNLQIAYNSGYRKIGIVAPKTDFGQSFTENMIKSAEAVPGFEVVVTSFFLTETVDFSPNITELLNADIDAILCPAEYVQFAPFAVQLRKVDENIPLMGAGTIYDPGLVEVGGAAVEGVRFPSLFNANSANPRVQEFSKAYEEKYDLTPNHISVLVYDSTSAVINAIEVTGSDDRTGIKDSLHSTPYEGVTGTIIFNENNECPKLQVVFEVKDGQFVEVPDMVQLWDDFVAGL